MSRFMLSGIVAVLVLSMPARADEAEDKAVAHIEKLNGSYLRDDKRPGSPVVWVSLHGQGTDADLRTLAPLKNLTMLYLGESKITNAGLKELAAFQNLATLRLEETDVSD